MSINDFIVIPEFVVRDTLWGNFEELRSVIKDAYLSHDTVNPNSSFLRFDATNQAKRIIALPARSGQAVGIKWVASVPGNISKGIPRASACIILNDFETGRPLALLGASELSLFRTAISAVLLAESVTSVDVFDYKNLAIVGCGELARTVLKAAIRSGWSFRSTSLFDADMARAYSFASFAEELGLSSVKVESCVADAFSRSDVGLFATSAARPYVSRNELSACKLILHLSLRDLLPEVLDDASNVVDDYYHAIRQNTSLSIANLAPHEVFEARKVLSGQKPQNTEKPVIISPFGLGILDVAVADRVRTLTDGNHMTTALSDFLI